MTSYLLPEDTTSGKKKAKEDVLRYNYRKVIRLYGVRANL